MSNISRYQKFIAEFDFIMIIVKQRTEKLRLVLPSCGHMLLALPYPLRADVTQLLLQYYTRSELKFGIISIKFSISFSTSTVGFTLPHPS